MPALAKGIESDPDNRPRVFISYSRVDKAQAEDLRDELIVGGFDAYLDAHDIEAGEPWKARLASLIANAEKVVFLISPSSIASEVCDWEIDEAERQAKGILPVLVRETKLETIPGRLTRLNFVFMTTTEEQNDNLPDLTRALSTDFEWEREKTEINDYAADWDSGGRSNRSLRFAEAKIAGWERWRDRHPPTAVAPTELHLTFITEARRVATQRQRRTVFAAISAAVVAVVLSIIAWTQREQAVENERRAEIERNTALTSQSQFLADLATQEIERGRADAGMLIALEGLPGPTAQETRPLVQEADIALTRAISQLRSIAVYQGDAALAPDWSRAVIEIDTNTATGARLIDPRTHTPIADLGQVGSAIFDPASTRLITEFTDYGDGAAPDRTILRDATTGAVLAELNPNAGARFSAGGRFVINGRAVWSSEEARHLYDLAPGAFVSFDSDEDVALSTRRADQGREFRLRDADTGTTLRKGAVQEIGIDGLRESLGLLTFHGVIEIVDFATAETVKTLDLDRLGKSDLDIYNLRFVGNGQTLRIMIRQAPDQDWNMIDDRLVEVTEETSFACPPENSPAPDSDDSVCFAAQSADGTRRVEFGDLEILLKDGEGQLISRLEGHPGDISRAIFAPDDSTLLTVTREETHIPYDEFARLWAAEDGSPLAALDHPGQEFQAGYSPSGRQIYTGHSGVTHFWHTEAGGRFPTLRSRGESDLLITDEAGRWASRIATDGLVEIMDFAAVPTRSCKAQLSGPGKFAEFVPNGGTLVVLGEDGHVTAIGSDCQETGTATDTGHGPRGLVVSKDGNRVAV
ncbi:MAG: toll/interleukin-1 receptor domain-containing protein, partial [Pseudomonadota bacterium]